MPHHRPFRIIEADPARPRRQRPPAPHTKADRNARLVKRFIDERPSLRALAADFDIAPTRVRRILDRELPRRGQAR